MHHDEPESPEGVDGARERFRTAESALFDAVGLEVRSRFIELDEPPVRIRVLEAGPRDDERPLVFVHGTGQFAGFPAPLMAEISDRRLVTFDRPGYGLSPPFVYDSTTLTETVVGTVGSVLDGLGLDGVELVGHSMGGGACLRYARTEPERVRRVVVLGAVPGFPGTRPPPQIKLLTAPVAGQLLRWAQPDGEAGVLAVAAVYGERDTIEDHPALIRAMAAHEADPAASRAGLSELSAVVRLRGWRPPARLEPSAISEIRVPTVFVVGDHDPLGGPSAVREGIEVLPNAQIESIDAGHIPFLGHPDRCAALVADGG